MQTPTSPVNFGMGAGHERRHFLVAGLDELDLALGPAQGAHDPVDAVAGKAEDPPDAPVVESLDEKIARRLAHTTPPFHQRVESLSSDPLRSTLLDAAGVRFRGSARS